MEPLELLAELGVSPLVNAGGMKTKAGGTFVDDEVAEAMRAIGRLSVMPEELNEAVGRYIAEVTGAEAGMVTSGAASSMVLAAAAVLSQGNIARVRRLPHDVGERDEIVIQKIHRNNYSSLFAAAGARLVEVGTVKGCAEEEFLDALGPRTAAAAYVVHPGLNTRGLPLDRFAALARISGVPTLVDAAAAVPPKKNLRALVEAGADLVGVSGGKGIRGPQASGLLFGRREMVRWATMNACPNHGIGRPHKVTSETIAGLYLALKRFVECDEEAANERLRQRLDIVMDQIPACRGLTIRVRHDTLRFLGPTLTIDAENDEAWAALAEIPTRLMSGTPRIYLRRRQETRRLEVSAIALRDSDTQLVARRLSQELARAFPRR